MLNVGRAVLRLPECKGEGPALSQVQSLLSDADPGECRRVNGAAWHHFRRILGWLTVAKGIADVLRTLRVGLPAITRSVVGMPASLADDTSTVPMSDLS